MLIINYAYNLSQHSKEAGSSYGLIIPALVDIKGHPARLEKQSPGLQSPWGFKRGAEISWERARLVQSIGFSPQQYIKVDTYQ